MRALRGLKAFRDDIRAVSAVEFALTLPLMLLLFFGAYVMSEAVTIRRKVSITTHTLADLTTQQIALTTQAMQTNLAAATQVMAPYSTAALTIRISEITTDVTGLIATVTWSTSTGATLQPYTCNQPFTALPVAMLAPSTSYIFSEVTYAYTPIVGSGLTQLAAGSFTLADRIYMSPRKSQAISYPCPG